MICPGCWLYRCARSRRNKAEYALSVFGILPWRCLDCQKRFYARRVPLRYLHLASCPRCGNLDLISVPRKRLSRHAGVRVATYLGARSVRCEGCRYSFASWRRPWRRPAHSKTATPSQTAIPSNH